MLINILIFIPSCTWWDGAQAYSIDMRWPMKYEQKFKEFGTEQGNILNAWLVPQLGFQWEDDLEQGPPT